MESKAQESNLNNFQKIILFLFLSLIISSLIFFRNIFFQPIIILKSLGESSVEPELAFSNNKPSFLEFYAEWCEVCKEMAPKVSALKDQYEKDINFIFLNVDNPKWGDYLRDFDVNGIPQINLIDKEGNLESTFIGKQDEQKIEESLEKLNLGIAVKNEKFNSDSSLLKDKRNYQASPRSHG